MANNFLLTQLFKSLKFSSKRIFTIFLAIFVAALVSGAFLNIYFDLEKKFSRELKAYGANVIISPKEGNFISNEALNALKKKLSNTPLTPYLYEFFNIDGTNSLVLGTDFANLKLTKPFIELVEGSFSLSDFSENSAFVGYDLALKMISENKKLSLKDLIGKEISLTGKDTKKVIIKGIVRSGDELDSLFLTSLSTTQELSKNYGILYAYALVYGDFEEVSAKAQNLSDEFVELKPISSVSLSEASVLEKLKGLMFLIVLVVLIITSLSVNTTLSAIILARKKEVALHLVLGATKKDIIQLFGLEAFILALCASFCGALCSFVLANAFGYVIFNSGIDFSIFAFICAIVLSLVFALVAAILPIKKALKINVSENLKGE